MNEPIFLKVVEALFELDQGKDVRLRKWAQHRASEYLIDEGKLWKLDGGHQVCAQTRVECITKEEATTLAERTSMQIKATGAAQKSTDGPHLEPMTRHLNHNSHLKVW